MKTFTKEEVYYFADFAHIAVGEDEVDTYAKELSVLAKFAERLQEVSSVKLCCSPPPLPTM